MFTWINFFNIPIFLSFFFFYFNREPLIVDPQGHLSDDDYYNIVSQFERARGRNYGKGPAMYIISPNDYFDDAGSYEGKQPNKKSSPTFSHSWGPTFTSEAPERMVLNRAATLARRSFSFLKKNIVSDTKGIAPDVCKWSAVFHETTASLKSFSVLLRVNNNFIVDSLSSSTGDDSAENDLLPATNKHGRMESIYTRCMQARCLGPKELRQKKAHYKNLQQDQNENDDGDEKDYKSILYNFRPVDETIHCLRQHFKSQAVFFFNHLCPEVIAIVWRPNIFKARPFTVVDSKFIHPVSDGWKSDTMVTLNVQDILREMSVYTQDVVSATKVFNPSKSHRMKLPRENENTNIDTRKKRKVSHATTDEISQNKRQSKKEGKEKEENESGSKSGSDSESGSESESGS